MNIPYDIFINMPMSTIDELICIAQISSETAVEIEVNKEFIINNSENADECNGNFFPTGVK